MALSLNSSALFFGQAGGAALGSLALMAVPSPRLGLIGATLALIALGVLWASERSHRRVLVVAPAE